MTIQLVPEFSLADLIGPELLQSYLGEGAAELLDRLVIVDPQAQATGGFGATIAVALENGPEPLPLLGDQVTLDFGTLMSGVTDELPVARVALTSDPFSLTIQFLPGLGLRFSPDLLVPLDGSEAVILPIGTAMSLVVDENGVHVTAPTLTLPKCGLGQTGIVLTGGTITLALWGSGGNPALLAVGVDDQFRGVVLQNIGFELPKGLDDSSGQLVSALKFPIATISRTGFSGRVEVNFGSGATMQLFGAEIAPGSLVIAVVQNALAGAGFSGTLTLPFFDTPVAVTVALSDQGWSASLSGGLAELALSGVLHLALTGLGIERCDGDVWFKVSGTLRPMLDVPGIINGADWPELELRDVMIDQHGHVKASGGKMALTSQKTVKIGKVIAASLTHFGFGTDPDGYQAVTLSGWVNLIEGIPARGAFDDLKIRWKTNSSGIVDKQFSLSGVAIDMSTPGVFDFKGAIAFVRAGAGESISGLSSHGFNGPIRLGLPAAGFSIDGQLAVREVTDGTDHYTALFITLDVGLPAGIPLFQSGLAIYGFNGLLAWHFGPNVQGGDWIGWFLGPTPPSTVGVSQLTKWQVDGPKKGLGAGITIGTLPDTGFSWNARTTFVVVIPGPTLILSGDGSFVSKDMGFNVKGALGVAIIFDGTAQTLSAAISADVGKAPVVHVTGAAGAFFDFNRPTAWFLNIGTSERPLQAKALQIFDATAYLGLTNNSLTFGALAGFDQQWSVGPLSAHARAQLKGVAVLIRRPMRFTGNASLDGLLDLRAFGVGATIGLVAVVDADLVAPTAVTPLAYHVHLGVDAFLNVKVLWKRVSVGSHIDVDFAGGNVMALMPPSLPISALSLEHVHSSETWPLAITPARNADGLYDGAAPEGAPTDGGPLVPPDALPTLVFAVPVNDAIAGLSQNPAVNVAATRVGNADYTFALTGILIETLDAQGNASAFVGKLTGKWCGESEKTRLQLWADTPYFLSRLTDETNRLADHQALREPPPCAQFVQVPQRTCASMEDAQRLTTGGGTFISPHTVVNDLALTLGSWRTASSSAVNFLPCDRVCFPKPSVRIEICCQGGGQGMTHVVGNNMADNARAVIAAAVTTPERPSPFTTLDTNDMVVPHKLSITNAGAVAIECAREVVTLRFELALGVQRICWITLDEQQRFDQEQAAAQMATAALSDSTHTKPDVRPMFASWSRYRITVITTATRAQDAAIFTFTDIGYFRTGGPPSLTAPAGQQPPNGAMDRYPMGGPLADLTRYLAGSVPAADTLAAEVPETAYRGYDPTLVFNEGYIPALYENAQAKLALQVLDQNSHPVTKGGGFLGRDGTLVKDGTGRIIAAAQVKKDICGHASIYRQLWQARLDECDIVQAYPPDAALALPLDPRVALAPRRRYALRATAGENGPVVCEVGFRTSRYLTVTHQIQSHPDLVVPIKAGNNVALNAALAKSAPLLPSALAKAEGDAFDALWDACGLGTPPERETLDAVALTTDTGAVSALLLTSPEPLPWDRIGVQAASAALSATTPAPIAPKRLKITHVILGSTSAVELLLLEDSDPSGLDIWADGLRIYRFVDEGRWPSGTIFRVYAGNASPASTADMQGRNSGKNFGPGLATVSVRVGLRTLHCRPVLSESAYTALPLRLVRKRDGTGAFLLQANATGVLTTFTSGELRLTLTIARDIGDPVRQWTRNGDGSAEQTQLYLRV